MREQKEAITGSMECYKTNFDHGDLKPNAKTIQLMLASLFNSSDIKDSQKAMYFWGELEKYGVEPTHNVFSEMIKVRFALALVCCMGYIRDTYTF